MKKIKIKQKWKWGKHFLFLFASGLAGWCMRGRPQTGQAIKIFDPRQEKKPKRQKLDKDTTWQGGT